MVDPRTQALVTFPVTLRLNTGDFGMEQSIRLVLMCQLLETKLLQLLRFRTGGVRPAASAQLPTRQHPGAAGGRCRLVSRDAISIVHSHSKQLLPLAQKLDNQIAVSQQMEYAGLRCTRSR